MLELLHALGDADGEVGVDIVVVGDGIGGACPTLHDGGVLTGNTVGAVVGLGGVADDARVPDMAHAHLPDLLQGGGREVVHLSAAVLGKRSVLFPRRILIPIQTSENLIDDSFLFHLGSCYWF